MSIFSQKKNLKKFKNLFKILLRLIINKPFTFYLEITNFLREYRSLKKETLNSEFKIYPSHPFLFDKKDSSLKLQYFHFQDLWAFNKLKSNNISELVDIGSNLSFITFASSLSKIKYLDLRPHKISLNNIDVVVGDITEIPFPNESVNNLSSLSVIEHIGLGRYGDKIDSDGMKKSVSEFERILKKNGNLIVSFPVGRENIIEFNAHRICNLKLINGLFKNFELKDETFIFSNRFNSRKEFLDNKEPDGIGCFHFIKS